MAKIVRRFCNDDYKQPHINLQSYNKILIRRKMANCR